MKINFFILYDILCRKGRAYDGGIYISYIEKVVATIVGSLLLGIAINFFLVPYHLLDGGLIGLGLIIHYYFQLPAGLSIILLSAPLYAYVWFFERSWLFRSLNGLLVSSLCIDLCSNIIIHWKLPIALSAILGGLLIGLGIGLMLRYETSTGGTDMLAHIISKKSGWNVGLFILFLDSCVLVSGINIVGATIFCYSVLTIIAGAFMTSITVRRYW